MVIKYINPLTLKKTRHCERAKQSPDARNYIEISTTTENHKYLLTLGLITLLSFMLLMFSPNISATEHFKITIKETAVQLGKPVWLDITTTQRNPSLKSIDFAPINDHFEVVKDKNEIRQTDKGQQWRIRLYPRLTGQLSITGLSFLAQTAPPITIQVETPIDSKTGQPFTIKHSLDHTQPWLRQQVLLRYEITSPIAQLVLEPQASTATNMLVIPLSTQTQQQADQYRHTTGWALYPRQAGRQTIQLPTLHYVRDGVVTHHFYPPPIKLEVKPLPGYLPGNLPVGKLSLLLNDLPGLLLKNNLSEIQLQLKGTGIPQQWLPDIRHFFKTDAQLMIYPAEPTSQQTTEAGISASHRYSLPIKPTVQGWLSLPSVALHYFDPATGKLAGLNLPEHSLLSLSVLSLAGLSLLLLGVTGWGLRETTHWVQPRWRSLRAYRAVLQKLPNLHTAAEFKQLITQLAAADGQSGNLSLRQWQASLPARTAELAARINQQLEPALYRGVGYEVEQVQAGIREVCVRRWGVLGWVRVV